MTSPQSPASAKVWERIDAEKRRDRMIKRVSISAWTVTMVLVLALLGLELASALQMARAAMVGAVPWMTVLGSAFPGLIILGVLSVLIATLSTVAMFFRLRTATLDEIQLRLAALEEMIVNRPAP
ncbi:MAG TPA: hypothetical protein VGI97_02305 [Gemmatimonadaceae bacterium]|jgi:hypothetical protein